MVDKRLSENILPLSQHNGINRFLNNESKLRISCVASWVYLPSRLSQQAARRVY